MKTCIICGKKIRGKTDYCAIHQNTEVQKKYKVFKNKINKGKSYAEYLVSLKPPKTDKLPSFF